VWSLRYIDAPVLRRHNTDDDGQSNSLSVNSLSAHLP